MQVPVDIPFVRVVEMKDGRGRAALGMEILGQVCLVKSVSDLDQDEIDRERERQERSAAYLLPVMLAEMFMKRYPSAAIEGWMDKNDPRNTATS